MNRCPLLFHRDHGLANDTECTRFVLVRKWKIWPTVLRFAEKRAIASPHRGRAKKVRSQMGRDLVIKALRADIVTAQACFDLSEVFLKETSMKNRFLGLALGASMLSVFSSWQWRRP
jgi:hypothetical protein